MSIAQINKLALDLVAHRSQLHAGRQGHFGYLANSA